MPSESQASRRQSCGGEEGVASVDADLHGLLGADEFEQQVEELSLVRRRRYQVSWVVGFDLAELLHALVLPRVNARLPDVLVERVALSERRVFYSSPEGAALSLDSGSSPHPPCFARLSLPGVTDNMATCMHVISLHVIKVDND